MVKESVCSVEDLGSMEEDPLVEGMATHSSILAWRIPMDSGAQQATKKFGATFIWKGCSQQHCLVIVSKTESNRHIAPGLHLGCLS